MESVDDGGDSLTEGDTLVNDKRVDQFFEYKPTESHAREWSNKYTSRVSDVYSHHMKNDRKKEQYEYNDMEHEGADGRGVIEQLVSSYEKDHIKKYPFDKAIYH